MIFIDSPELNIIKYLHKLDINIAFRTNNNEWPMFQFNEISLEQKANEFTNWIASMGRAMSDKQAKPSNKWWRSTRVIKAKRKLENRTKNTLLWNLGTGCYKELPEKRYPKRSSASVGNAVKLQRLNHSIDARFLRLKQYAWVPEYVRCWYNPFHRIS